MSHGLPFLSRSRRPSVLSRAVARWRAGNYNSTLDALVDESGNGLHARLGSVVGADTNDPKRLLLSDGGKRLYFPGVAGNSISSPVIAATSGLFSFRFFMRGDNAAANPYFHYNFDGTEMSLRLLASGAVRFTRGTTNDSSAISGITTTGAWGRVDYNTATGAVNHYTSTDGTNWSANGSGSVSSGAVTSSAHVVGLLGASILDGFVTQFQIYVDSVKVAGFNATTLAEPYATVADEVSGSWTLNRSASGRKLCVVDRDLLQLGTDDYLLVPDSPLLNVGVKGSFTLAALFRKYGTATNWFIQKGADNGGGGDPGYQIRANITAGPNHGLLVEDTSARIVTGQTGTSGVLQCVAGVRRGGIDIATAVDGVFPARNADTLAGSSTNTKPFVIGTNFGTYGNFEFMGAAFLREALSAADLVRLKQEMLAR